MNTQDINRRIRLVMDLRTKGITDAKVLGAMERVPRDEFVPAAVRDQAWDDMALPIGRGQTISQPFVVASMTQALKLSDMDKVLEIGTGCGYQTAILSKLCRRVYTIERHKPLLVRAEQMFEHLKLRNITALAGDGMKGWPKISGIQQAPFDKIIVTAAAREKPPQALLDQLKPGGMMIIPVGPSGDQWLKLYKKESDEAYAVRDIMPVRFVPLLPDIAKDDEGEISKNAAV
ncbi:MAG: protein-L-isoaspartate(D-aspartate) O-methyltransferase [Alphaproteobacteria bacterium]|nr:protein-L-isoaspartate(D-aspartate) O-methyltransferase [Alphaproteobacteria bacterium]